MHFVLIIFQLKLYKFQLIHVGAAQDVLHQASLNGEPCKLELLFHRVKVIHIVIDRGVVLMYFDAMHYRGMVSVKHITNTCIRYALVSQ